MNLHFAAHKPLLILQSESTVYLTYVLRNYFLVIVQKHEWSHFCLDAVHFQVSNKNPSELLPLKTCSSLYGVFTHSRYFFLLLFKKYVEHQQFLAPTCPDKRLGCSFHGWGSHVLFKLQSASSIHRRICWRSCRSALLILSFQSKPCGLEIHKWLHSRGLENDNPPVCMFLRLSFRWPLLQLTDLYIERRWRSGDSWVFGVEVFEHV